MRVHKFAKERKLTMQIYQLVREDLFNNILRLSHNIYSDRPRNLTFELTPLAFVIITKLLFYALLTVVALFSIYYTFHFACLLDNACFAQNYGVKL